MGLRWSGAKWVAFFPRISPTDIHLSAALPSHPPLAASGVRTGHLAVTPRNRRVLQWRRAVPAHQGVSERVARDLRLRRGRDRVGSVGVGRETGAPRALQGAGWDSANDVGDRDVDQGKRAEEGCPTKGKHSPVVAKEPIADVVRRGDKRNHRMGRNHPGVRKRVTDSPRHQNQTPLHFESRSSSRLHRELTRSPR